MIAAKIDRSSAEVIDDLVMDSSTALPATTMAAVISIGVIAGTIVTTAAIIRTVSGIMAAGVTAKTSLSSGSVEMNRSVVRGRSPIPLAQSVQGF